MVTTGEVMAADTGTERRAALIDAAGLLRRSPPQQEPADEREPDAVHDADGEEQHDTEADHQVGEHAADADGAVDAPLAGALPPPEDRAEQATTVKRETRGQG